VVRFDERASAFSRTLPHARPFVIEVHTPAAVAAVKLRIWVQEDRSCKRGKAAAKVYDGSLLGAGSAKHGAAKGPRRFAVRLPGLRYATRYCVSVDNYQRWDAALETALQRTIEGLPEALASQDTLDLAAARARLKLLDGYRLRATLGEAKPLIEVISRWISTQPALRAAHHAARRVALLRPQLRADLRDVASVDLARLAAVAFADGGIPAGVELLLTRRRGLLASKGLDASGQRKDAQLFERSRSQVHAIYCATNTSKRRKKPKTSAGLLRFCRGLAVVSPLVQRLEAQLERLRSEQRSLDNAKRKLGRALTAKLPSWRRGASGAFPFGASDAVEGGTAGGGLPYISADLGLLVPLFIERGGDVADVGLAAYIGVNVYFTPIDKDTPLSLDDGFWKRFAVTVGFTINNVEDADDTVEGVLFGKGILFGAGFRVTDHARAGVGVVLLRQRDRNPAVGDKKLKIAPYLSLSVDFDVASALKSAFVKEAKILP
jgi:hypothetical protein